MTFPPFGCGPTLRRDGRRSSGSRAMSACRPARAGVAAARQAKEPGHVGVIVNACVNNRGEWAGPSFWNGG